MPSGRARGRGRYTLLARAIKNKPFQCSDGRDSPQRRHTAARVERGRGGGVEFNSQNEVDKRFLPSTSNTNDEEFCDPELTSSTLHCKYALHATTPTGEVIAYIMENNTEWNGLAASAKWGVHIMQYMQYIDLCIFCI